MVTSKLQSTKLLNIQEFGNTSFKLTTNCMVKTRNHFNES